MDDPNEQVKRHMQKINEAIQNNNSEKMRRHYTAILEIYGHFDEDE